MSSIGIRLGHRALQESSCTSCVETPDCVYCPSSQTYSGFGYGEIGTCVCKSYDYSNGFFDGTVSCGIYEEQFNSRLDCQFDTEKGEVILAVILIFVGIAIILICGCISKSGTCSDESFLPPSNPSAASVPRRPAYTPEETAPRPESIPDRPESLRVCPIMATDVVLVPSAPLEEPIVVIPAESEIIVSRQQYDV